MPFERFKAKYPKKRAMAEAEQVYWWIRRQGVTEERIEQGLERYLRNLPEDAKWIPHPANWLRGYRFDDEYDEPVKPVKEFWGDECQRLHGGVCACQWDHSYRLWKDKRQEEAS